MPTNAPVTDEYPDDTWTPYKKAPHNKAPHHDKPVHKEHPHKYEAKDDYGKPEHKYEHKPHGHDHKDKPHGHEHKAHYSKADIMRRGPGSAHYGEEMMPNPMMGPVHPRFPAGPVSIEGPQHMAAHPMEAQEMQDAENNDGVDSVLDMDSALDLSGGEDDATKPLIVTLGDYVMRQGSFGTGVVTASDTASGWVSRLAAAYGQKAQVVNKGQATATSREGVEMVNELLAEHPEGDLKRVKLVVLSFGANDAITRDGETGPKVSINEYRANMKAMVDKLQSAGVKNIMVVTPPPAARRMDRRFKTIKDYARTAADVARDNKLPTVDLFAAVSTLPNWQASVMREDGLRLSERGQQLLFKRVMKTLGAKLQAVSPGKLVRKH